MSYSTRQNANGGELYSHSLKRSFPFKQTRDNSDLRRAERELADAERQVRDAATARLGRAPTLREENFGYTPPADKNQERAQIRADVREMVQNGFQPGAPDPDANIWNIALANAEGELKRAQLPADKAQAARRVEMYREKHAAWQANRDREKAAELLAADPKRAEALTDAESQWRELSSRPDVQQADVERARQRMEMLANGAMTTEDYQLLSVTHQAEMDSRRQAQADQLDSQARELRAQSRQLRSGEPPAPSTEPQATEPTPAT